jgi:protein TonB
MKSIICLIILILVLVREGDAQATTDSLTTAATNSIQRDYGDEIFVFVDTEATPVDGYEAFYDYILRNIKYPKDAREAKITGKVIVEFVVEKDGHLSPKNIKILKSPHKSLSKEAIRLIKTGPKWIAGKQHGIPVRTRKVFPISFKLG